MPALAAVARGLGAGVLEILGVLSTEFRRGQYEGRDPPTEPSPAGTATEPIPEHSPLAAAIIERARTVR